MSSHAALTLIARIESMPTLPAVALRVMEVTADPKSSANDLMGIISPDVSLTTKILKIANSSFLWPDKKNILPSTRTNGPGFQGNQEPGNIYRCI